MPGTDNYQLKAPQSIVPRAFISYSRSDAEVVTRLVEELNSRRVQALIDRNDIDNFEDWWDRIQVLIQTADIYVFAISPHALASTVCLRELAYAVEQNCRRARTPSRSSQP